MTREQARPVLFSEGKKLTHNRFSPDEWIKAEGEIILTEDGCDFTDVFNIHPIFSAGWEEFIEKS